MKIPRIIVYSTCVGFVAILLCILIAQYVFYPWKNNIGAEFEAGQQLKIRYGSQEDEATYQILNVTKTGIKSSIYEIGYSYNGHSGLVEIEYENPRFKFIKITETK